MPGKKAKAAPAKKQTAKSDKAAALGPIKSIKKMLGGLAKTSGKVAPKAVEKKAAKGAAVPAKAPANAGKGVQAKKGAAQAKVEAQAPSQATKGAGRGGKGGIAPAAIEKAAQRVASAGTAGASASGAGARGSKASAKAAAESVAAGAPVCREVACELIATTGGYCRMHYIKNWKKIKRKEIILKEKKLNSYIEELVSKYPDKYIEAIRQDLASEKDFAKVIADLEIEEGLDDFESVDTESAEGIIDNIKRDFEDEGDVF